jgi:hypothetical protein
MKQIVLISAIVLVAGFSHAQKIIITEGDGVGLLKIGQSMDELVNILGFKGTLKSYEDYVAEELFTEDPAKSLECIIGFDYYIKYQHLITVPVSYIFIKNNVVSQIKLTSFPEYFFGISRATTTSNGLPFWANKDEMIKLYGNPDATREYESFILETSVYFDRGIAFSFRDSNYRVAHIFKKPSADLIKKFNSQG